MGIYDREYYRRDGTGFLSTQGGQVCKWLILINIVAFVAQLVTLPRPTVDPFAARSLGPVTEWLALYPQAVFQGQVWRLVTYAFLHDPHSLWHILFNMLFLWWMGRDMEDLYGPREFFCFYILAALVGGVAYTLTAPLQAAPAGEAMPFVRGPCLGASGAVTAVMVLFAFHYPNRIILLFFILPVPIWLLVLVSVALDAFTFLSGDTGPVAVAVHLGGAAFGFLYYKLQWRLVGLTDGFRSRLRGGRRVRPRLRVYREEPPGEAFAAPPPPPVSRADEHLEAQVDAVLEKVSRYGQESLTDDEREILFRASEVYKKRRP